MKWIKVVREINSGFVTERSYEFIVVKDEYIVKPALTAKTLSTVFKTAGGSIKLTKNGKSISFLFEVICRDDNWEKKFVEKTFKMWKNIV